MSFSETVFLFFLALIIFGPKKLPEIARQVGKALNDFKRASNEFKAQIEQEIAHLEVEKPQIPAPSLTSASWAGNSAATEGLAPEGTASRSLTSEKPNSPPATSEEMAPESTQEPGNPPIATLSAPESPNGHGNPCISPIATDAAAIAVPSGGSVTDTVEVPSTQESHG